MSYLDELRKLKALLDKGVITSGEYEEHKKRILPISGVLPEGDINPPNCPTFKASLKRAILYIEDGEIEKATAYLNGILDYDPECAEAYVGLLMIEMGVSLEEELGEAATSLEESRNYIKAVRFGDSALIKRLKHYNIFSGKSEAEREIAKEIFEEMRREEEKAEAQRQETQKKIEKARKIFNISGNATPKEIDEIYYRKIAVIKPSDSNVRNIVDEAYYVLTNDI